MDAISVEGVSKRFKERGKWFWALKDVSLQVKEGEIFGLLGPNGAGKTTLLNIMVQLIEPDSGAVKILGEDVRGNYGLLEKVNYVSGDTRFHWVLTVEDVLDFYSVAYRIPKGERKARIGELISFFGLEQVRERRFTSLSTGERMRLIFSKAMLNKPKVLLLDEPTLGLDPSIALQVRKEVSRVNRLFGTTILLTSHYMAEVEQLSRRIAFIYEGKIVDVGEVGKVKARQFGTYDIAVRVDRLPGKAFLKKNGLHAKGRLLEKTLQSGESMSELLSALHRGGFKVIDVETRKPTLEDYFVKMLGGNG